MGDTNGPESAENNPNPPSDDVQRTSVDRLHEARPSENISINSINKDQREKPTPSNKSLPQMSNDTTARIETVFEKLDVNSDKSDSTSESAMVYPEKKAEVKEAKNERKIEKIEKKKSDGGVKEISNTKGGDVYCVPSGRIYKQRDLNSTVFPVGTMGCKDELLEQTPRRFIDAHEAAQDYTGHLENTPRKRPTSGRTDNRNPVTGAGINCDVVKKTSHRKKDGNPVLGLGYEDEPLLPSQRKAAQPGGYTDGLW